MCLTERRRLCFYNYYYIICIIYLNYIYICNTLGVIYNRYIIFLNVFVFKAQISFRCVWQRFHTQATSKFLLCFISPLMKEYKL